MRTPRAVLVALTTAFALLVGGCGAGPAPRAWAANVCTALTPWRTEISTLASRTQQQMTAKTTPAQAKENLVRLLGGAESASETARSKVEKAGVPDVDGGEDVAKGFVRSLTSMRDAYGRARQSIEGLDAGLADPFYDGVESVMSKLTTEYNQSALDTSSLASEELRVAFDEVPECR
ncbi:hypothetical protein RB614_39120 [Phytohabitans sp. ZYX-F-186]|uniref:Lipoprotein n=1 Tax=Phytohabitans maris TaxID=3071409 RepID=A0ABU0ZU77_9ACTN|nr:hypothetical protein [Phytohabitans sp. ZYX-F-186]MDQ7910525.1 hypothetical protein [Phytohabitans sp. ZYX-F-186]